MVRLELRVRERGGFYEEEMRCLGATWKEENDAAAATTLAGKGIVYRSGRMPIDRGAPRQSTTGFWGLGLCLHALILGKTVISG